MSHRNTNALTILAASVIGLLLIGCTTPPGPYVPKSLAAPQVVYCNDNTGHKAGSSPYILGGTCCCTPSDALMAQLQKDGFCQGMSADELAARYSQAGIALAGEGHQHCAGLCAKGPHVVLGGKCMCPPTPGTDYYESVIFGRGAVPNRFAASGAK